MPAYKDAIDWKILNALLKQGKINFTGFRKLEFAKQSRRRHLDKLEKEKLIRNDKKADWRRGQSINYSLTEKGKKACILNNAEGVNQALKIITDTLNEWSNKPELFLEYRKAMRKLNPKAPDTDNDILILDVQERLTHAIFAFDKLQLGLSTHVM